MIEVDYNAVVGGTDRPTELKSPKLAAMGSPPLPRRRPPLRPRKPAELAPAAASAAAGSANGSMAKHDSSQRFPPHRAEMRPPPHPQEKTDPRRDEEEQQQEELAKLMLSPQGLAQQQQQQQQQQQIAVGPSSRVTESLAAAAALSITWIELDTFGFDIAALASIRRGRGAVEERSVYEAGATGRKRSWGGGSRDARGQESLVLVLSWGVGGAGPAEVAFELATPVERDLVASTLEMLVAGLVGDEEQEEAGEKEERSERERASDCGAELGVEHAGDTATATTAWNDAHGGGGICGDETADTAAAAAASAASATPPAKGRNATEADAVLDPGAGASTSGAPSRLSSCSDTAVAAGREVWCVGRSRPGIRRRGASFSPARQGVVVVPELTRSWTSGSVMGQRESEPEPLQPEREEQARRRRQGAMARLLAMYDRTRDEARAASWRLGAIRLKRLLSAAATRQTEKCWARWCGAVRRANEGRQKADRRMWYLHAKANQDNDLLAWYHATFCREVYRRRVPFWFRETQLKPYQKAYRIVDDGDNSYTGWEKSIMSSCVCTVGTKYADVAAQLFTAKDVLAPEEYRLFLTLVKRGTEVPKAASKSGRKFPHPMKLRLWFNRGSLCLTAKRHKPDSATSKDHSFYLSKVKTCVVALPAAAGGGGGGSRRGSGRGSKRHGNNSSGSELPAPDSLGSNSSSTYSGGGVDSFGCGGVSAFPAPSPSDANDGSVVDVGGYERRRSLSTPTAAVAAASFALPSPLHSPVPPLYLHDAGSGGGRGRGLREFPHDEADRGAGGRSGGSQDGDGGGIGSSSSEGIAYTQRQQQEPESRSLISPTAAPSGQGEGMVGAGGSSSRRRRRHHQQHPHQRVLSIHFFGRSITLDLWFATEVEAVEWQGMLTKLSWKEQGYLYRGSPPSPHEICSDEEEEEELEERGFAATRETEQGARPGEVEEEERDRDAACRPGSDGGTGNESGNGNGSKGGRDAGRLSLGSAAPSASSSCSSLVAADWSHATHGRPPPPPPPSPQPLR
ncbi:unnamed protein product [Scytosiphon promiscuus]